MGRRTTRSFRNHGGLNIDDEQKKQSNNLFFFVVFEGQPL